MRRRAGKNAYATGLCYGRRHIPLEELHALEGDGFRRGRYIAPDRRRGRQFSQCKSEAFDGKPPVIVQIPQCLEDARPFYVTTAGDAAIVFTSVDMLQMLANGAIRLGNVF